MFTAPDTGASEWDLNLENYPCVGQRGIFTVCALPNSSHPHSLRTKPSNPTSGAEVDPQCSPLINEIRGYRVYIGVI